MIYTFYSYKGGVGRSMAVANVAQWFYEQGLRVVIVDWDLEAPGLESFFVSSDEVEKVKAKPGLIDMLLAYQDKYPLMRLTASAASGTAEAVVEGLKEMAAGGGAELEDQPKPPHRLDTRRAVEILERELPPLAYMLYPLRSPAAALPRAGARPVAAVGGLAHEGEIRRVRAGRAGF